MCDVESDVENATEPADSESDCDELIDSYGYYGMLSFTYPYQGTIKARTHDVLDWKYFCDEWEDWNANVDLVAVHLSEIFNNFKIRTCSIPFLDGDTQNLVYDYVFPKKYFQIDFEMYIARQMSICVRRKELNGCEIDPLLDIKFRTKPLCSTFGLKILQIWIDHFEGQNKWKRKFIQLEQDILRLLQNLKRKRI